MPQILIYTGLAINIIGALFLMAYAMKYTYAFRKAKDNPILLQNLKPQWAKKRTIGFTAILLGLLIAIIGCLI